MPLTEMELKSNLHKYKVYFFKKKDFVKKLSELPNSVFIIDKNVWDLHKYNTLSEIKDFKNLILLEIREEIKNLESVQKLYDEVLKFSPKRNMNVISIGGGITQDITGFMASTI
jgi:3-dehydroquinate synthase